MVDVDIKQDEQTQDVDGGSKIDAWAALILIVSVTSFLLFWVSQQ